MKKIKENGESNLELVPESSMGKEKNSESQQDLAKRERNEG